MNVWKLWLHKLTLKAGPLNFIWQRKKTDSDSNFCFRHKLAFPLKQRSEEKEKTNSQNLGRLHINIKSKPSSSTAEIWKFVIPLTVPSHIETVLPLPLKSWEPQPTHTHNILFIYEARQAKMKSTAPFMLWRADLWSVPPKRVLLQIPLKNFHDLLNSYHSIFKRFAKLLHF